MGARKALPVFPVGKKRDKIALLCIASPVLSTPSNAIQSQRGSLPHCNAVHAMKIVIRFFLCLFRRPCSLRSLWGEFTRFWYVAERARRGRETALFSPVGAFTPLRDIVGGTPLAGHGAGLSRPLCVVLNHSTYAGDFLFCFS